MSNPTWGPLQYVKHVFADFHLRLPAVTQLWLDISEWRHSEGDWAIV